MVAGQNERSLTANAFNIVRFIGGRRSELRRGLPFRPKSGTPLLVIQQQRCRTNIQPIIVGRHVGRQQKKHTCRQRQKSIYLVTFDFDFSRARIPFLAIPVLAESTFFTR
jgi:hypothetical protein